MDEDGGHGGQPSAARTGSAFVGQTPLLGRWICVCAIGMCVQISCIGVAFFPGNVIASAHILAKFGSCLFIYQGSLSAVPIV